METGSGLFGKFLKGNHLPRFLFIPLIGTLAAKVGGLHYREMCADPTLWTNSIQKTVDLFDLDGVVGGLDFSLVAEACGAEITWDDEQPTISARPGVLNAAPENNGRLKNSLEAMKRLFHICHNQRVCIAATTGPITLAHQLFGVTDDVEYINAAKQIVTRLTEIYCQCKPNIVLYMEGKPFGETEVTPVSRRAYNTLKNVASYYRVVPALYVEGYIPHLLPSFSVLNMILNIAGPSREGSLPSSSTLWDLNVNTSGIVLSVPVDDIDSAKAMIQQGIEFNRKGKPCLHTSHGPVAANTPLEAMHLVVREIKNIRL